MVDVLVLENINLDKMLSKHPSLHEKRLNLQTGVWLKHNKYNKNKYFIKINRKVIINLLIYVV